VGRLVDTLAHWNKLLCGESRRCLGHGPDWRQQGQREEREGVFMSPKGQVALTIGAWHQLTTNSCMHAVIASPDMSHSPLTVGCLCVAGWQTTCCTWVTPCASGTTSVLRTSEPQVLLCMWVGHEGGRARGPVSGFSDRGVNMFDKAHFAQLEK
jgi:hypothetical protein